MEKVETKNILANKEKKNFNNIVQAFNLTIGIILDEKYEIKREISRGGMGIVYEAYDQYMHRQVAIKVILGNKIDELQLKRFQKEIEACGRLSHPNVIKIYDAGTYNNNPYIVMEYVDGVNIGQYIMRQDEAFGQEEKERDWKLCARLIYETALGLEYIHQQKMFHRDIKPTNIIVRSNGSPVIIDFGLVKFNQERSYNLTRSRDIIGTCQYMPIEQAQGKRGQIDARSDVYSLGLVLYELLTEKQAYNGKNMTDVFKKIVSYFPPTPREINPKIPEVLDEITIHAIEKQKEKRYATAQAFADALKHYLDGKITQTTNQYSYYPKKPGTQKKLWMQKNKSKFFACCIALLLTIVVVSKLCKPELSPEEQYKLGVEYEQKQNDEEAIKWYKKAAENGDKDAQVKLGAIYYKKKEYKQAIEWYEKAAKNGDKDAQVKLGAIYYNGSKDYKKATECYEKAAKNGDKDAQYQLGIIYYNGLNGSKDYKKALYWLEQAESQGHSEATFHIKKIRQEQGKD